MLIIQLINAIIIELTAYILLESFSFENCFADIIITLAKNNILELFIPYFLYIHLFFVLSIISLKEEIISTILLIFFAFFLAILLESPDIIEK